MRYFPSAPHNIYVWHLKDFLSTSNKSYAKADFQITQNCFTNKFMDVCAFLIYRYQTGVKYVTNRDFVAGKFCRGHKTIFKLCFYVSL